MIVCVCCVEPAIVIGGDVVPAGLELVAEIPQKLTLYVLVESINGTTAEVTNLCIAEVGRIEQAFAILDRGEGVLSIGTKHGCSTIEIYCDTGWKIRLWAINLLTCIAEGCIVIIESAEPQCTHICCKRPLANPDVVFDSIPICSCVLISLAVMIKLLLLVIWEVSAPPCLIEVCV